MVKWHSHFRGVISNKWKSSKQTRELSNHLPTWMLITGYRRHNHVTALVQKYLYRKVLKSVDIATWLNKMCGGNSVNKINFVKTVPYSTDLINIKIKFLIILLSQTSLNWLKKPFLLSQVWLNWLKKLFC
jgi:hypothetical protein